MKTLITVLTISLISINSFASTNFNCSAQMKGDRNNSICSNSLLSNTTKAKLNCAMANKDSKSSSNKAVR